MMRTGRPRLRPHPRAAAEGRADPLRSCARRQVVPDLKERLPGRGLWLTAIGRRRRRRGEAQGFRPLLQSRSQGSRRASGSGRAASRRGGLSALALANKAGEATFGNAKVEEAIAGGVASFSPDPCQGSGRGRLPQTRRQGPPASSGRPVPAIRAFGTDELSLATGRTNVIHAALIQGGAAESVLDGGLALERYRKGKAAFASENGPETDKE